MTFMLDSPWNSADPFPWYQQMRHLAPVYTIPESKEWHVFSYEDVKRVLSDFQHFSSDFGEVPDFPIESSILRMDPPRHGQLRSLISKAFTPRTVQQLAPRIEQIADELLDAVPVDGQMDLVRDFSYPLPVIVISELLGIPTEDRAQFKQWSDELVHQEEILDSSGRSIYDNQREMSEYFRWIIEQRRHNPQDDLISALIAAEVEGEKLSEEDLLGFCILLLVAGNETTTNLITNAILSLDKNPAAMAQVESYPEQIPDMLEEVLRYRSPIKSMPRLTTQNVQLGEHLIPQGEVVFAWIASANHDASVFSDPHRFDIGRKPNKHLTFGHGIHFCLGASLARLEGKIALTKLLARMKDIRCDPHHPLEPFESWIVYGFKQLPITYSIRF